MPGSTLAFAVATASAATATITTAVGIAAATVSLPGVPASARATDLLRLVAVPAFAWAAYRDVRTRRVPNRLWLPLAALGAVLLAWDAAVRLPFDPADRLFALRVAISLGFVVPLSYAFWRIGGFGGADAKAFMTLAVLFPATPVYYLPTTSLPFVAATLGVFSMTVLTNTVLLGLAYPLGIAVRNALAGELSPRMVLAVRQPVERVERAHGRLVEGPDGFDRSGLDLDALRMYLRWRGLDLATLRRAPDDYRDPESVDETYDPTDGAVAPDGGRPSTGESRGPDRGDPWAAAAFLDAVGHDAYGTTPETLREGLEVLATREAVWVSPGIPFIVPTFAGLVVGLTYGDLLVAALGALGVL
jgi:preflagellin peptidase FlaK